MFEFPKNYLKDKKIIFIIEFILLFSFEIVKSNDCIFRTYSHLQYIKAITLDNNNKVMLSRYGIFTYEPKLLEPIDTHAFSNEQKLDEDDLINTILKADISQFSGEDGETKYVLCIVRKIVYVLNDNGKVIFYKDISSKLNSNSYISLVPFKYSNNSYYFILAYLKEYYYLSLQYYEITFNGENVDEITFLYDYEDRPIYEDVTYWGNSLNICCNKMYLSNNKVLTCSFSVFGDKSSFVVLTFNPDDNFSILLCKSFYEPEQKDFYYLKSSTNKERTKSLICYTIETPKGKCVYYDINENTISDVFIESNFCSSEAYGLNTYYFEQTNEFIFSCVNGENKFFMKRIDSNFNIIDDDNLFNGKQLDYCTDYRTFSVVYISEYDIYSNLAYFKCNGALVLCFLHLLDETCQIPEKNNKIITTIPEAIITIVTTMPEIITTIVTTMPEIITTIVTTMPEIITTI